MLRVYLEDLLEHLDCYLVLVEVDESSSLEEVCLNMVGINFNAFVAKLNRFIILLLRVTRSLDLAYGQVSQIDLL